MSPQDRAREQGNGPPERKPFLLRLPPELMEDLRVWANQDLRSLNAHIEYLLRQAVEQRTGGSASRARGKKK